MFLLLDFFGKKLLIYGSVCLKTGRKKIESVYNLDNVDYLLTSDNMDSKAYFNFWSLPFPIKTLLRFNWQFYQLITF